MRHIVPGGLGDVAPGPIASGGASPRLTPSMALERIARRAEAIHVLSGRETASPSARNDGDPVSGFAAIDTAREKT